ncbi:MAG: four helix bundle protein [Bacteroidota bacterium]|nr:four helix bundle protein [Bacteroidota bacterium]
MRNVKEILVWEKAHAMTLSIYRVTQSFPKSEMYGLTGQLRRAARSVPANIAEGCGRHTEAEFAHFLQIAAGSASEVEYHLLLARDLDYITSENYNKLDFQINKI